MPVTLADICSISSGYTARSRLEEVADGVLTLQLRDIGDGAEIRAGELMRSSFEGAVDRYLVGAGDIVFRSKGERNVAAYLGRDFPSRAVALLPVMILRAKSVVMSEYLVWAINQTESQRHFEGDMRSGTIRSVPKATLESLPVDLPDLETQRKVVEIDRLLRKELELSSELLALRQKLVSQELKMRVKAAPIQAANRRK